MLPKFSAEPFKIIIWGETFNEREALDFIKGGTAGFLLKVAEVPEILQAFREVAEGRLYLGASTTEERPFRKSARFPQALTPREVQVRELVERGLKNGQVAAELGIQAGTVKIHLKHIFEKLGVRNRFSLALQGMNGGNRQVVH